VWHSIFFDGIQWYDEPTPSWKATHNNNNNNNNNNNKGSRGMGEVAPLYGVDPALVLTNPGVQ